MTLESRNSLNYTNKFSNDNLVPVYITKKELRYCIEAFEELHKLVNNPATYHNRGMLHNGLCPNFYCLVYNKGLKFSTEEFLKILFWNWEHHSGWQAYPVNDINSSSLPNVQYLRDKYSGEQLKLRISLVNYSLRKL